MDAKTMQKWQGEIDIFMSRIEEISDALQAEFDDLPEKHQDGAKGESLRMKIENLELAKDALGNAYSSLLE